MRNDLQPPSETTRIRSDKALVLAPHFDDDVFGCGGLLAQLAAARTDVCVLFLTDGSGGEEPIADRRAYSERRHGEAVRALEILGVTEVEFLDLPDGSLVTHVDEAAEGIRRTLIDRRPDLLLSMSPLERTFDHRAAFAALYNVLSPLRGGTELDRAVAGLDILLFGFNHPDYHDVLVDVGGELEQLTRAIKAHASQLELHNYLEGALGIRSHRALSLPTSVTAAEGFRRLTVNDFVTRSQSALIRRLGGVPELLEVHAGPTISVIVRTMDRPDFLNQALASLAESTYRRFDVVVVNDGGQPPAPPEDFPVPLAVVNLPDNRGRAAAANAGIEAATGDWITFLDDDDLAEPEHLATLARLASAAGVRVAYTDTAVGIYELDPESGWREVERRLPFSRDFDPDLLLFDNYIPFNTLIIDKTALAEAGPFDVELPFFEDWDMLIRLAALTPFHHLGQVTAEYRHFRGGGHHIFGEQPGERADFLEMKAKVIARHRARHTPEILAKTVSKLRAETVAAQEAMTIRTAELEDAYDRLNGERETLAAELESHRTALAEQEENVQRLYSEIDRLGNIIDAMEGTKAWRLHRRFEALRGRKR
ncbi:MAG: PIG-L family deacetylase [Thermoanaerobaculales bacterium]